MANGQLRRHRFFGVYSRTRVVIPRRTTGKRARKKKKGGRGALNVHTPTRPAHVPDARVSTTTSSSSSPDASSAACASVH